MNPEARAALLDHYDRECRDLPWRNETDPYRILVSEVMLQQTRVATVLEYYEPWLARFPDVVSLADAPEDEVLKAWEGLGYYRRARNLHRAAAVVRDRPTAAFPDRYETLRELPGVGEYTAGAVASIAFGQVVPAVDGNVRRVFARFFDHADPKPSWLRARATEMVDPERPGDWNQALMELGATVCTPRSPRCEACPVADWCAARAAGNQADRPLPAKKSKVRSESFAVGVFRDGDRVLLVQREGEGLLGGMWSFPEAGLGDVGSVAPAAAVFQRLAENRGLEIVGSGRAMEPVAHRFSHIAATYLPWLFDVRARAGWVGARETEGAGAHGGRWVDPSAELDIALPRAQQKILAQVSRSMPVEAT